MHHIHISSNSSQCVHVHVLLQQHSWSIFTLDLANEML